MNKKVILDACCAGRMFWFNKQHPNALYIDKRAEEKGFVSQRPSYEVQPDEIMDFRDLKFPDKSFKLVVFDPPHIMRIGNKSWMSQKYGMLDRNWEKDLAKGFSECWRVLEDYGVLIFKWSESEISCRKVLSPRHIWPSQPRTRQPLADQTSHHLSEEVSDRPSASLQHHSSLLCIS